MNKFDPNKLSNGSSQLLTSAQAADMLGMSKAFLARDRWAGKRFGKGPQVPFIKCGGRAVRYLLEDVQTHIAKSRVA